MRYMAQRTLTGEWLHRDLPIEGAERTRELSGPGQITGRITPDVRDLRHTDGLRVLEHDATTIYAVDDALPGSPIKQAGILVNPVGYDDVGVNLVAPGFASYPHGYPFTGAFNWGVRVDPTVIFRDHWAWIQRQERSNLDVRVVRYGNSTTTTRVGTNEEPYALSWVDQVDLGEEMDSLAQQAPFDYVEEHTWQTSNLEAVTHRIVIGAPRLGRERTDLMFREGINLANPLEGETNDEYANDVIGIGNGEGAKMIHSRAAVNDGRLKRIRYITDKTIANTAQMDALVRDYLRRLTSRVDVSEFVIVDHPDAPIATIMLGDDLPLEWDLPSFGDIKTNMRVLAITESDDNPGIATLTTARSDSFFYSATVEGVAL